MKKPPIIVFVEGISLIPSQGSHTQKIPPITSVKDNRVKSAAGIFFDPIEYKIRPIQTIVPWVANKVSFLLLDKKLASLIEIIADENKKQIKPAKATVVNFGVSFLHLKLTENIEKPNADTNPKIRPIIVFSSLFPKAITVNPKVATNIAIHTVIKILSLKNKNPKRAVIKGIAARQSKVTAAVVLVIDQINVIIAVARPKPPINPEKPIFK